MIGNFIMRAGSTLPWLEVQLTKDGFVDLNLQAPKVQGCGEKCDDGDDEISLDGATVVFSLSRAGRVLEAVGLTGTSEVLVDAERNIDETCGYVRYKWNANDLTVPGLYYGQWTVTFADKTVLKWPFQIEQLTVEVF